MSRKIYIGEDNLINLKNAMVGKNIGHSTFMQEDKPPYEKDEFTIDPEGGANDNFHIGDDAINEHHLDQRLPFDEKEFSRKRYIEQYVDWLEEFGRYGELPDGTLDFWEEIAKAVKIIREGTLHGRYDTSLPLSRSDEEIVAELKNEIIGPDLDLKNGKVRIERAVNLNKSPRRFNINNGEYLANDDLYNELISDYNDNVGGCWCYKDGGAMSYCSDGDSAYTIKLYGFIRTDDIDFVKTVQLNYHYRNEHEIRVKPFAKIEMDGIGYGGKGYIGFDRHLIVSATYSGNNSKYNGEYGKIDDGFGNTTLIDRNRNVINKGTINSVLERYLKGKSISKLASNGYENRYNLQIAKDYGAGLCAIYVPVFDKNRYNFYDSSNNKILLDDWVNDIYGAYEIGVVTVNRYNGDKNECNFFSLYKKRLVSDRWFPYARNINNNGLVIVGNEDNTCDYFSVFEEKMITNEHFKNALSFVRNIYGEQESLAYKGDEKYIIKTSKNGEVTINKSNTNESKKGKSIILPENKLISIKENLENEVEANEVSLDSFKKQKELAPKIWNGDKLNSRVRLKLLDIADDFWETTDIGWVKPKGIVLMGSICNYNWSKSSDIDLHLQVDFSEVDEKKDFVQEYFNGKKNEWNEEHSNLKIFGFPVELYVEDIDADTNSGGVYDLEENDWIKKPSKDGIKQIGLDKYSIKDKSAKIMTDIDDLYGLFKKTDDDAKLRKIGEKAHNLLGKIKEMRKDGLSRGGESDKDNIVYKVLRRTGYMDILWNLSSQLYDKLNSIDESVKTISEESERDNDLISYFNWAKSATDAEKACDFAKRYPEVTGRFIGSRIRYFSQFEDLYLRLKRDKSLLNDDSFIEEFGKIVEECRILDDYLTFAKIQINLFNEPKNKIPTWMYMKLNRIVDNEWCIHFCNNAKAIASEGFKWGTKNVDSLSFTDSGAEKEGVGYNFAFPIGEYSINSNGYGSFRFKNNNIEKCSQEAVIFKTSGVEVEHTGDEQRQVIFWGGDAKSIIPIEYDYKNKTWVLLNRNGELMCSGRPSEILDWVVSNSSKVIPESVLNDIMSMSLLNEEVVADGNADHNPFKKRWKYERETLINYLTNYGEIMTSKENGKQYKVIFDDMLSSRIGLNYCLCIQWNPMTMEPGNVIYVRALDKFTRRIFKPEFDTRGFDNVAGTYDDVV